MLRSRRDMERLPLFAIGPQDVHSTNTFWDPIYKQHTNFQLYHRFIPLQDTKYIGNTITVELKPTTLGDLISNMYLKCSLNNSTTIPRVGRYIIKQIDFMINDQIIESLTDDWYQIRDEIFLDDDEKKDVTTLVSDASELLIPLDFFFCRRFSHDKSRPVQYFPMCSLVSQKVYIKIQFNTAEWVGIPNLELVKPELLLEEIILSDAERIYYRTQKIDMMIPKIKKEPVYPYNTGSLSIPLTASFPVQALFWFFRRKSYETDSTQSLNRYTYGYKNNSPFGLPLPGTGKNFNDPIKQATIYLNGNNILGTLQGGVYYRFKQPFSRGLTVPVNDIYTYSFGLGTGQGTADFSKLDSSRTFLNIDFLDKYTSQIAFNFNMYIYYYGWTLLTFQFGSGSLSYVG